LPRSCSGLQLSLKFITGKCWRDLSLHLISLNPHLCRASEEVTWIFSPDIRLGSHFSSLTLDISYSVAVKREKKMFTWFILKALSIQSVTHTTGSNPQDKVARCHLQHQTHKNMIKVQRNDVKQ